MQSYLLPIDPSRSRLRPLRVLSAICLAFHEGCGSSFVRDCRGVASFSRPFPRSVNEQSSSQGPKTRPRLSPKPAFFPDGPKQQNPQPHLRLRVNGSDRGPVLQSSPGRARTYDKRINSPLLYQLSYRGSRETNRSSLCRVLSLENVISMGKAVSKQFSCNSVFLHPDCQSIRWIQQDQNCFLRGGVWYRSP